MTSGEDAAIADAAQVLREKVDVLLDRLTDAVLRSPVPGTPQWHSLIHESGDLTRVTRGSHRSDIRAFIAARAGITDPTATQRLSPSPVGAAPKRRRRCMDPAQLLIF